MDQSKKTKRSRKEMEAGMHEDEDALFGKDE
jgi:hypothetical protein